MSTGDLLDVHPSELRFIFEVRRQGSCALQLSNKTDKFVAFKVKTTSPKKYCVRPNSGIVLPRTSCSVTVTMQAQKEAPPGMECKDKFLLQCALAPEGAAAKDITSEMFTKEEGKVVEEFKLRVVYIPATPPSPVPEGSDEGNSPRESVADHESNNASIPDSVLYKSFDGSRDQSSEAWTSMTKLTAEKNSIIQQNQSLRQEMELLRKEVHKKRAAGFSLTFVLLVALFSILLGYLVM
uniref:MSP domain-containing protein n=1 Tax=Kalanchoe fedtschenkoi TaxID=63787 RepID=A0A7N0UY09_KALFE